MTAFAPLQRYHALPGQLGATGASGVDLEGEALVIESSGEQPWAEFCKGLREPAFLLAVTGFGDLDYA
jgi:hypothetical protein